MYILTQTGPLEKREDNIYRVQDAALEKKYTEAGYLQRERTYKIMRGHSEYIIHCYEFRHSEDESEPVVIIPEFLVPGRPYPLEVYLYAIDLYSSNPEKGQRWTAAETRKHFGLKTFAHTTLGRALKSLVNGLNKIIGSETAEAQTDSSGSVDDSKRSLFPTAASTAAVRKRSAWFLGGVANQDGQLNIDAYYEIARKWFETHGRLLL